MRKYLLLIISLISILIGPLSAQERKTMYLDGHTREYLLYLPRTYKENSPANLIVCLHGFNRTMYDFFDNYSIKGIADALNMVVVVPQALPEQRTGVKNVAKIIKALGYDIPLDAVWGCGLKLKAKWGFLAYNAELNENLDDAAFIHRLVQQTQSEYFPSGANVFLFGTSMGGFMSYQYALSHGEELAGLISICGSMGTAIRNTEAELSVPICDFHSLSDEVVPYAGSMKKSGLDITLCQPKTDVIGFWIQKNKASVIPTIEEVNDYPSGNNDKTAKKYTYAHPTHEVIHYQIDGASHDYYFRKENGDCMDYNEEVYAFIRAHTGGSTGFIAPQMQTLSVYPNPARDIIYLGVQSGEARIMNLNGGLVLSRSFRSGSLDVSSLRAGIYLIRVSDGENIRSGKFVKR